MIKLTQTGVGAVSNGFVVRDTDGTGLLAAQVAIEGTATYRIMGRVSPEAIWRELRAPSTEPMLECMALVPYVQLEVTAGTGTATLWIAER